MRKQLRQRRARSDDDSDVEDGGHDDDVSDHASDGTVDLDPEREDPASEEEDDAHDIAAVRVSDHDEDVFDDDDDDLLCALLDDDDDVRSIMGPPPPAAPTVSDVGSIGDLSPPAVPIHSCALPWMHSERVNTLLPQTSLSTQDALWSSSTLLHKGTRSS